MTTPDGRYIVVRGRLWRAANPHLPENERESLTAALMQARRDVAAALRVNDARAERDARRRVDRAKRLLGERGPVWWTDGAADLNRRLVRNTPYREWFEAQERWEHAILEMLSERDPSKTICPSEVARRVEPERWRRHMNDVRDAARRLAARNEVRITQRGIMVDPEAGRRGAIRNRAGGGYRGE
jgi:hypothetical protein